MIVAAIRLRKEASRLWCCLWRIQCALRATLHAFGTAIDALISERALDFALPTCKRQLVLSR